MSDKFETEIATITYIANVEIDYGNEYDDTKVYIYLPSEKFSKNGDTDRLSFKLSEIITDIKDYEYDTDLNVEDNISEWINLVIDELGSYLYQNTRNFDDSGLSELADTIIWKVFEHCKDEINKAMKHNKGDI